MENTTKPPTPIALLVLCCVLLPKSLMAGAVKDCSDYRVVGSNVVLEGKNVAGADVSTFHCIEGEYGADHKSVFFGTRRMSSIDPASFRVLGYGYSKDKFNVYYDYYSGKILKGADALTFEAFDHEVSKDKNSVYKVPVMGSPVIKLNAADTLTFRRFGEDCYRDKNHFYNVEVEILRSDDEIGLGGICRASTKQ